MELRELQFFVVSVDAGSLSQAAQILYTTQPHVSKTIKKLERTLGYQLLERSKKGVELTKEGEKVYDQARKMFSFHGRNPENSDGDAGEYDPYRIYAKQSSE